MKPQKLVISKGNASSIDVSLTSTQYGAAIVIAEAVGFEAATTSVVFAPPSRPSELDLTAQPNENIIANGRDSTKLTVKLLNPDSEWRKFNDGTIYI